MRYFISHHQHKGNEIDLALKQEGWLFKHRKPDLVLLDHYINKAKPEEGRGLMKRYYTDGSVIISYPHGATGSWWMDNDSYPPNKMVFANLVIGEGHKYVEEIILPNLNHYVIGWSYCPIKEFKKHEIKKILFAPIHASFRDDNLRSEALDANSRIYDALLNLQSRYQIMVRHLNPLGSIGLKYNSKIKYNWAKPDGSYEDIDNADLVIAEGTYMYMAVARGKPTIGINQHIPIRPNSNEPFILKNWDKYGDYMAYPIDFDDGKLEDLIDAAAKEEQTQWKKLFIGNQMDSKKLSNLLKDSIKKYKKEF